MRTGLPQVLKPGQQFILKWTGITISSETYPLYGGQGYENFPEDGNDLYTMTQWYP